MKVVCDRASLLDALTMAHGVVATRTTQPALLCVRLTARNGQLHIAATDMELSLRLSVAQVDVKSEGETLVPADKLLQIVRASEDSTVTLEVVKHVLHLKGADSHFKVFGQDPKNFPAMPEPGEKSLACEIPAGHLRRLITRTLFATAVENSRYAINGVLFDRQGRKLRLVATDGRRLALARGECSTAAEGDQRSIVPTKALNVFTRLVDEADAPVKIAIESNQIRFTIGAGDESSILVSNLVEGSFPPFEDVIPKDQDKRVTLDSGELTSAVRRAALLTNEESKGVRLAFADKKLTLSSRAPEMGEAEIQLDIADYHGEAIEIGFNPGFIIDALKVVEGSQVMLELKSANKPGVFRLGTEFTYVVMPVSLS